MKLVHIIKKLVNAGADASIANKINTYPVHEVIDIKQLDIISKAKSKLILIDRPNKIDFDINVQNHLGETLLHMIFRIQDYPINLDNFVAKILNYGGNCNIVDIYGR